MNNNEGMPEAMNLFRVEFHQFVQECMFYGGFEAIVEEGSANYLYFLSNILSIEYGFTSSEAESLKKSSNKRKIGHFKIDDEVVDDSKFISSLNYFTKNYEAFLSKILLKSHHDIKDKELREKALSQLRRLAFEEKSEWFEKISHKSHKPKERNKELQVNNEKSSSNADSLKSKDSEKKYALGGISLRNKYDYFSIYNATRLGKIILIKVINDEDSSQIEEIKYKLENELEVIKHISHPGIRKSIDKTYFEGRPALLLERIQGETINNIGKFRVYDFLVISREIVSALVALHSCHVLHNNINTDHIIVDSDKRNATLIGFSGSTLYSSHRCFVTKSEYSSNNMNFLAPEKINRIVPKNEFRSDFYSLGIVFYYMLVGHLPFQSANRSELLFKHRFVLHETLVDLDKNIPVAISNMVDKLMAKRADHRYHSAKGILFDLDLMTSEYKDNPTLQDIKIAKHDISDVFSIPDELYGRHSEAIILRSALDKISSGSSEVVSISGSAGTGKTSLVVNLYANVAFQRGFLIRGKFDQILHDSPYSGLAKAFEEFCNIISTGCPEVLDELKTKLNESMTENCYELLSTVVRNLHLITGKKHNAVIDDDMRNEYYCHFRPIFVKFLNKLSSLKRPFVIILDDVQWADSDTLDLLSWLFTNNESMKYVLFVLIHRDDEAPDSLHEVLKIIREKSKSFAEIKLINFNMQLLNDLISCTFKRSQIDVLPFTAFVHDKTKGNPFFVVQFLLSLVHRKLVYFDYERHYWKWDVNLNGDAEISKCINVTLTERILELDKTTQDFLTNASCIGNDIPQEILKLVAGESNAINDSIFNGFIAPVFSCDPSYCFSHDFMQQAAYSLIPPNLLKQKKLRLGKQLWEKINWDSHNNHLNIVANLINSATSAVVDKEDRKKVARLNLIVGGRAKISGAFDLAKGYLQAGINFLEVSWDGEYDLRLKLYDNLADVAYCSTNYPLMQSAADHVIQNAVGDLDRTNVRILQLRRFIAEKNFQEAIDLGFSTLEKLGENFPSSLNISIVTSAVNKVKQLLLGDIDRIKALPLMKENKYLSIMQVLLYLDHACKYTSAHHSAIVALRMIEITLQHGISQYSSFGFAVIGSFLCSIGDVQTGSELGKKSLYLVEKFPIKEVMVKVYILVYGTINIWYQHIAMSLDPFLMTFEAGREIGSHENCAVCMSVYCHLSFFSGLNLLKLNDEIEELKTYSSSNLVVNSIHYLVLRLLGKIAHYPKVPTLEIMHGELDTFLIHLHIMVIDYNFHEYDSAAKIIEKSKPFSSHINCMYSYAMYIFYQGLISITQVKANSSDTSLWKCVTSQSIAQIKDWSVSGPANFKNKLKLLIAEDLGCASDDYQKVLKLYNEAIVLSSKYNQTHDEALSSERAGLYCIENSLYSEATKYLSHAYSKYEKWGSKSKNDHLKLLVGPYLKDSSKFPLNIFKKENKEEIYIDVSLPSSK